MGTVIVTTLPIVGEYGNALNTEWNGETPPLLDGIAAADYYALVEAGRRHETTTRAKTRRLISDALAEIGWTVQEARALYVEARKAADTDSKPVSKQAKTAKRGSNALTPVETALLHDYAKRTGLKSGDTAYKAMIHALVAARKA
jgi:hypothetical protein